MGAVFLAYCSFSFGAACLGGSAWFGWLGGSPVCVLLAGGVLGSSRILWVVFWCVYWAAYSCLIKIGGASGAVSVLLLFLRAFELLSRWLWLLCSCGGGLWALLALFAWLCLLLKLHGWLLANTLRLFDAFGWGFLPLLALAVFWTARFGALNAFGSRFVQFAAPGVL